MNEERKSMPGVDILYKQGANPPPTEFTGAAIDVNNVEMTDVFELGELPMHLVKEYKSTYMSQISIEKFLILKVKETEKENRLLRS